MAGNSYTNALPRRKLSSWAMRRWLEILSVRAWPILSNHIVESHVGVNFYWNSKNSHFFRKNFEIHLYVQLDQFHDLSSSHHIREHLQLFLLQLLFHRFLPNVIVCQFPDIHCRCIQKYYFQFLVAFFRILLNSYVLRFSNDDKKWIRLTAGIHGPPFTFVVGSVLVRSAPRLWKFSLSWFGPVRDLNFCPVWSVDPCLTVYLNIHQSHQSSSERSHIHSYKVLFSLLFAISISFCKLFLLKYKILLLIHF